MTVEHWINGAGVLAILWVLVRAVMVWRSGEGNRIGDYLLESGPQRIQVERALSAARFLVVVGFVFVGIGLGLYVLGLYVPPPDILLVGLVSLGFGMAFLTIVAMSKWPEVVIGHNAVILMTVLIFTLFDGVASRVSDGHQGAGGDAFTLMAA